MSSDLQPVKQALQGAGIEIYRTKDDEIQVAERVRLHIMDSGIRILGGAALRICFTARSQRSDFPYAEPEALFERVRTTVGDSAGTRGYVEVGASTVEVEDPSNEGRVLDVWHEVTYEKSIGDISEIVDEVRWALEVDKYVTG